MSKLLGLPTELLQMIAHDLPNEHDVSCFILTHPAIAGALVSIPGEPWDSPVWKKRLSGRFDLPSSWDSKLRYDVARRMHFHLGRPRLGFDELGFLRVTPKFRNAFGRLILDAYSHGGSSSNSLRTLEETVAKHDLFGLLLSNFTARPHHGRATLRAHLLCVAHLAVNPDPANVPRVLHYPESRSVAFQPDVVCHLFSPKSPGATALSIMQSPAARMGIQVNVFLHILNFWRSHFCSDAASSAIAQELQSTAPANRPQPWTSQIVTSGSTPVLGRRWKGCAAHLLPSQVRDIRFHPRGSPGVIDQFSEADFLDDGFTELELRFLADEERLIWPDDFQAHINLPIETLQASHRNQTNTAWITKATAMNQPMIGKLKSDGQTQWLTGNVHRLGREAPHQQPEQYEDIFGFQRIVVMQRPAPPNASDDDDGNDGGDSSRFSPRAVAARSHICPQTHAWEGLVLPGGNLMLGRWWYANSLPSTGLALATRDHYQRTHQLCSGPFIYWRVP